MSWRQGDALKSKTTDDDAGWRCVTDEDEDERKEAALLSATVSA